MSRPFNLNFDGVVWEHNDAHLQAWKDGRTGFPIVDAAMRALKTQGYLHVRLPFPSLSGRAEDPRDPSLPRVMRTEKADEVLDVVCRTDVG
jgi:hypothetical protein